MAIFHEDRDDAAITLGPDADVPAVDVVRTRGMVVEEATGESCAIADPCPDDVERLLSRHAGATATGARDRGPALEECRVGLEEAVEVVQRLARHAMEAYPAARASVRWVEFDQRVHVTAPGRPVAFDRRQGRWVRLRIDVERGGRQASAVGELVLRPGASAFPAATLRQMAAETAARAEIRLSARALPTAERPVVFAPGVGGILFHETVGHALEADAIAAGSSWLAGRAARPFQGSRDLLVVDDPRRGRAAWRTDDEAEPARATCLVRDGAVAGWLHDRASAAASGAAPTGHGRRSGFREPVRPRMGCTFLAPGASDPEEALRGVEEGVYVRRMEAASTDTATGRARFRVSDADRIRHGRIVSPLSPHVLHVDARRALASIERVAGDLAFDRCVGSCVHHGQPLSTSVGAPTFRIGCAGVVF